MSGKMRFGLLIVVLALAACGRVTSTPAVTPTMGPTFTPETAATATVVPSSTSTHTPEPTHTHTPTPTATPATPPAGPEGYTLKSLTSAEMMEVLEQAETIDRSAEKPYGYMDLFYYMQTIKQEAILRFPDVAEQVYWDLVYQEAYTGYPVADLVTGLEKALNSGQVEPDGLEEWLAGWRLPVEVRYQVPNLFGDGRFADVLLVSARPSYQVYLSTALIALDGSVPDRPWVVPVRARWHEYNGMGWPGKETISIGDLNHNGRPEIMSVIQDCGHNGCSYDLGLYEWQEQEARFVDLGPQFQYGSVFASGSYELSGDTWSLGITNTNGTRPIVETWQFVYPDAEGCLPCQTQKYYNWDGQRFVQTDKIIAPYDATQSIECAVVWAEYVWESLPDQAQELLASAIQNWPAGADRIWGPAGQDYWRFKLGTWYALHGQIDLAQSTLASVRDHPANPNFDVASQFAGAYLVAYQAGHDPYAACQALVEPVRAALVVAKTSASADIISVLKSRWGFAEPQWDMRFIWMSIDDRPEGWLDYFCDKNMALAQSQANLEQSLRTVKPGTQAELARWFEQKGIPVWVIGPAQITDQGAVDGSRDWLAFVGLGGNGAPGLWAMVADAQGLIADRVVEMPYGITTTVPVTWQHFSLVQEPLSLSVLVVGDVINIYRIFRQDAAIQAERILGYETGQDYEIGVVDGLTEVMIRQKDGSTRSYVWDVGEHQFTFKPPSGPTDAERRRNDARVWAIIEPVEQAFFPQGDIACARDLLEQLFAGDTLANSSYDDSKELGRPLYLLGLTRELTGDSQQAVEAYWQLWKQYPDSPYVLIIRRKLEPK